ncbi:mannitol-1-phosphate 5-dehydrogenase [Paenactinomyces guangxiensis]|uniref:Mannitol-1-phosphate 5-dehydrogenase n=1 Tax=Paenactinomyces guangxiensis TaxID=1490290 RepID=A0A7W2A853_9BACL|nr:mannitol-1-phosphate 5-dehydrogenase [Paenactinomyces guangxiensis]MBA4495241.1 mannitol-1-phosphate 5-dehydrogenase [Paenactinomyces guangxiensis]MBH8592325.1 mannitol-1-phosphate 5-dehydrogenase [Paenactinomyces guangxiensis]
MLAVHFGAGNIGRGFIGEILHDAGYDISFVDINAEMVDLLNSKKKYKIVFADQGKNEQFITGISAINSKVEPDKVIESIVRADLVTTAVGPDILVNISDLLAKSLKRRSEITDKPLNIIACENMIGGSTFLKEKVYEKLSDEEKTLFNRLYAFPDAAVDRIVPSQINDDRLMVEVEPYYEWVVDQSAIKGELPAISGIKFVPELAPYIVRKLFTVNTGHAAIAYFGYMKGFARIDEAIKDKEVYHAVSGALKETGRVIVSKYDFDWDSHQDYINKILLRFKNPYIIDSVTRVGRSPLRKLGKNDRLLGPALSYYQLFGKVPENLSKIIAAVLLFDAEDDQEARALKHLIRNQGVEKALSETVELEEQHPIIQKSIEYYKLHLKEKEITIRDSSKRL